MVHKLMLSLALGLFLGYVGLFVYARSDPAKQWFETIASEAIGAAVKTERISLMPPMTLVAYNVDAGRQKVARITMILSWGQVLGPSQTITGNGELKGGRTFAFAMEGSLWSGSLRSLEVNVDRWPLRALLVRWGIQRYLQTPVTGGTINARLTRLKNGWQLDGQTANVSLDLSEIAALSGLPRAFPRRTRAVMGPLHLRLGGDHVSFVEPLTIKTRMGNIELLGKLRRQSRGWHWQARAVTSGAQAARPGYAHALRCVQEPNKDLFTITGPLAGPTCR